MSKNLPIVLKLQSDANDSSVSVTELLITAKTIATKLDLADALEWINLEINGYPRTYEGEVPNYRECKGMLEAFNPQLGWQSIVFGDADVEKIYRQARNGQGMASIEDMISDRSATSFERPLPSNIKMSLARAINFETDIRLIIDRAQIVQIPHAVRDRILTWALELEKAGIVGEGMMFSKKNKEDAVPVTQNFINSTIGSVGNASDQSSITVNQTNGLNIDEVRQLVDQVLENCAALPGDVGKVAQELSEELSQESPNETKLRTSLQSLRNICEGATGNLTANGILHLLSQIPII